MEAIIFDLFGTLIDKEKYDYNNALRWLANTYFDNRFDELQKLSLMFSNRQIILAYEKAQSRTSFSPA